MRSGNLYEVLKIICQIEQEWLSNQGYRIFIYCGLPANLELSVVFKSVHSQPSNYHINGWVTVTTKLDQLSLVSNQPSYDRSRDSTYDPKYSIIMTILCHLHLSLNNLLLFFWLKDSYAKPLPTDEEAILHGPLVFIRCLKFLKVMSRDAVSYIICYY